MGRLHPIIGVIIFLYLFPKLHNLGVYENLYHASDPKSAFNLKIGFWKSQTCDCDLGHKYYESGKVVFISYRLILMSNLLMKS